MITYIANSFVIVAISIKLIIYTIDYTQALHVGISFDPLHLGNSNLCSESQRRGRAQVPFDETFSCCYESILYVHSMYVDREALLHPAVCEMVV